MTELVHSLLGYGADEYNLNKRLGRAQGKEVFHHGAEVDNYFFLQELDKKIAVIIPSNRNLPPFLKTGAVETKEGHLPRVLASLQAHGYLIVDNPMMATMPADIGHRFSGKKSVQQTDKDEAEKMDAFMNCVIRMRGVYQWPRSVSSDWVDAGSEESCVESHRESCRRVSPSIKALTSATHPYKLDEKHYSKLVLLGRSLAAQRERLLMSHYFRKDEKDVAGQDSAVGHFLPREKATRLKSLNKQITKSFCKDTSNCVDKIKECLDTLETTGASLPSGCTPIMKRRLWLVKRATTSAMAAFTWSQAHKTKQAFNEIITFVEKALAKKALAKKALAEQGMALLRGRMEMGSPP